jgi:hypothetical protein
MEIDRTIHAARHHRFHYCGAESTRVGADTGGPSRSVQFIVNASPSAPQPICKRPTSVESAQYFPALVASSCRASPMACAEAAFKHNLGPRTTIREPMRSRRGRAEREPDPRFPPHAMHSV